MSQMELWVFRQRLVEAVLETYSTVFLHTTAVQLMFCDPSVRAWRWNGICSGFAGCVPRIRSEARSPIIMIGAFRLLDIIEGITEPSTIRSPSMPRTRVCASTTAI